MKWMSCIEILSYLSKNKNKEIVKHFTIKFDTTNVHFNFNFSILEINIRRYYLLDYEKYSF